MSEQKVDETKKVIDEEAAKLAKVFDQNRGIVMTPEQIAALQSTYVKQIEVITANQNAQFLKVMESMKPKVEGVPSSPAGGAGGSNDNIRKVAEWFNSKEPHTYWDLSKEAYMKEWSRAYKEAVTSTNVPGIAFDRDVLQIPGGQTVVNIRPYFNFKAVPEGSETFHWHKLGKFTVAATPDNTTITPASQTLSRIAGTVVRRGGTQEVGYLQERSLPVDLVQSINDSIVAALVHDEAVEGLKAPATATGGDLTAANWRRGDTGAEISADDTASVKMKFEGLNKAVELLETEGYNRSDVTAFLHPKQMAELREDSIVTRQVNPFSSQLLVDGQIQQYLGIRIVPTTAVHKATNTTNAAFRAILAASKALGLATKDVVEIEADRRIDKAQTLIGGGHYIAAKVIESGGYIRVSTTA